jgi:hypothetical protein
LGCSFCCLVQRKTQKTIDVLCVLLDQKSSSWLRMVCSAALLYFSNNLAKWKPYPFCFVDRKHHAWKDFDVLRVLLDQKSTSFSADGLLCCSSSYIKIKNLVKHGLLLSSR